MNIKAILFDADGVLALPEEFFSLVYARSRGLDPAPFEQFFKEQFPAALIGQADLKELIASDPCLWQWHGDTDQLLQLWFDTENVRNEPLLELIRKTRANRIPCYIATNQEKYRGQYLRERMFKDEFDGFFIAAELGLKKPDKAYYEEVLRRLKHDLPNIEAHEVLFFDDSAANIAAAQSVGIQARVYHQLADAEDLLQKFLASE